MANSYTYKSSGVDIDAGNRMVDKIKAFCANTRRPEVLSGIGGFGGLFALGQYKNPVLVSGTDGVGTKLKLAIKLQQHDTIGIDLVAMCVNDILVTGAEPLFFLDYFATGTLDPNLGAEVVKGIAQGCQMAGCALIGGETAEMPGMYQEKDYDLAGFCVGVVEHEHIIDGNQIQPGDVVLALASSGIHSNGYSLVRKLLKDKNINLDTSIDTKTLGEILLTPTKIYVKPILNLLAQRGIKGMAHITGGGIIENIPRILPEDTKVCIQQKSWEFPFIFQWLQEQGQIHTHEMYRTFNCGVGFILICEDSEANKIIQYFQEIGEYCWQIGSVEKRNNQERITLC